MIHSTPEPRLEPNHHYEEYIHSDDDELEADFIQQEDNDTIDESFIFYEEGEIRDLLRREPW